MSDLKDKLDKSYDTDSSYLKRKSREDKMKKFALIGGGVLLLAVIIFIVIKVGKGGNQEKVEQNQKIQQETRVVDNVGKENKTEQKEEVSISNPDERPKEVKEDFADKIEATEDNIRQIGTSDEYKLVDKETTKKRDNFYNERYNLNSQVRTLIPSVKDGYYSDPSKKGTTNYVPRTAEDVTSFLSHELEKRSNPRYVGEDTGEEGTITSLVVKEVQHIADGVDLDVYIPEYQVTYTIDRYRGDQYIDSDEGYFSFIIDEEGNIKWVS